MKPLYILGVDLGQAQDFTAIVVLERTEVDTGKTRTEIEHGGSVYNGATGRFYGGPRRVEHPVTENHYAARHLERLPIGTPYPAQVARVKELHDHLKAQGHAPFLVVDQTGVGRPVVDMLRAVDLTPTAVNITITLDTYTHVIPSLQRESADKLDALLFPQEKRGAAAALN